MMYSIQGLTLRPSHLPGASKSMMRASREIVLLAPKCIKFNFFVSICAEKLQFCAEKLQFCDDEFDFLNFGQVSQNLNVKPRYYPLGYTRLL